LLDEIKLAPDVSLEYLILDAERDGIEQISEAIAGLSDLSAVHIVSHGADGVVELGNSELSASTLTQYQSQLNGWRDSMTDDADLLFYGCDLAYSENGRAMLDCQQSVNAMLLQAMIQPVTNHWVETGSWNTTAG